MKAYRLPIQGCLATLLLLLIFACEIDNYEPPGGGLHGRIFDVETGENVPQPVPSDFGLRLRFYEAGSKDNPMEQHFYAQTDGSFRNSHLFNGPIRLALEQRNFLPVDTIDIVIEGQTQCDIPVVPYLRFHIDHAASDGHKATVRFSISRSNDAAFQYCKITECQLLWNVSPAVDNQTVHYAGKATESALYRSDAELLSDAYAMELDFSSTDHQQQIKQLAPLIRGNGNLIYLRLCATTSESTGNDRNYYYNYSEVIPIEINIHSLLISIQ
jgi:hypothetical protein